MSYTGTSPCQILSHTAMQSPHDDDDDRGNNDGVDGDNIDQFI